MAHVDGKRVLRLMRRASLLAPQRARRRRTLKARHGTIIPAGPNLRWGADGTWPTRATTGGSGSSPAWTTSTAEAWPHVSASGTATPLCSRSTTPGRIGGREAGRRGLALRHDWGPQYLVTFLGSLRWLGIAGDASYVGDRVQRCAERWIKTLKEQCLWARPYDDVDDRRAAVTTFVIPTTTSGSIQRHGHQTKYLASLSSEAA